MPLISSTFFLSQQLSSDRNIFTMQINALLIASALAATCSGAAAPLPTARAVIPRLNSNEYLNYTTLTGFFAQDDPATDVSTFDYVSLPITMYQDRVNFRQTTTNFGLLNISYPTDNEIYPSSTQWQKFEHYVWRLNRGSGRFVQYKVLYMGRHGEGYHNTAETYYGTPAWNVRIQPLKDTDPIIKTNS